MLDKDWEAESCRIAEAHPLVRAYAKNHHLGLEVPYRWGSEDLLHLIFVIKGYRHQNARQKASTMRTYWVPGVNHLKANGRWAFAELTNIFEMPNRLATRVRGEFDRMIQAAAKEANP